MNRTLIVLALLTVGCSKADVAVEAESHESQTATSATAGRHDHGAWWCGEHAVPEKICGLCNSKLAAEFKARGDWCAKHDRPQSQCFDCKPELREKFAALYEAQFGEPPPKTN